MKRFLDLVKKVVYRGVAVFVGGEFYARRCGVVVGENCRIYTSHFGPDAFLITIGDKVTITSGVKILVHDGSSWLINENGVRYQNFQRVNIGSNVFIGVNSIILPGVTIGSRVVIGAGSVVTRDIPDNSVAVGNPARVIQSFDAFEERARKVCINDRELEGLRNYKDRVLYAVDLRKNKDEI